MWCSSEASMAIVLRGAWHKEIAGIRLAVVDTWKPFRHATQTHAPQAAIPFDKFHIMAHLGNALDAVRKAQYARLSGKDRRYIKGQEYTLLAHRENLNLDGKAALKHPLAANKRLNTAYYSKRRGSRLLRSTFARDVRLPFTASVHKTAPSVSQGSLL